MATDYGIECTLCGNKWLAPEEECPCQKKPDMIESPPHYRQGTIEVIDAIEGMGLGDDWLLAHVVRYVARCRHKGRELEDLRKARFYLDRKIKQVEGKAK